MSKIVWDAIGEHIYETGVDHGVLYPMEDNGTYGVGVAWNGLTSVSQSPSGAEPTDLYADNIKYLSILSAEDFGATVEAYTYPEEFEDCDGSREITTGVRIGQQVRKSFGLCYRTIIGNDVKNNEYGYKIHIIYNAKASPSERSYETVNDSPDAITFSWELTTTPINVTGFKAAAHLEIDSTKFTTEAQKAKLKSLEDMLYGTDPDVSQGSEGTSPTLPSPDDIVYHLTH